MRLNKSSRGQSYLEYALILILVVIVVIILVYLLGPAIANMYNNVIQKIQATPLPTP